MFEEDTPQAFAAPRLPGQVGGELRRHRGCRIARSRVHRTREFIFASDQRRRADVGACEAAGGAFALGLSARG